MGAGQGIAAAVVAAGLAGSAGGQGGGDEPTPPRYKEKATTVSTSVVESGRYGLDSWALEVTDGYQLPTPTTVPVTDGLARFGQSGTCQEDQPCWNWRTMGNRARGTCHNGELWIEHADGRVTDTHPGKSQGCAYLNH